MEVITSISDTEYQSEDLKVRIRLTQKGIVVISSCKSSMFQDFDDSDTGFQVQGLCYPPKITKKR